jgi:hypothetical protein
MRDVSSMALSQLLAGDGLPLGRELPVDGLMTPAFMVCLPRYPA